MLSDCSLMKLVSSKVSMGKNVLILLTLQLFNFFVFYTSLAFTLSDQGVSHEGKCKPGFQMHEL